MEPPTVNHHDDLYELLNSWIDRGWRVAPPHACELGAHPRCTWCGEVGGRAALVFSNGSERRWVAVCQICRHAIWMEL